MELKNDDNWREKSLLYSHLISMGNIFPLKQQASCYHLREQLGAFQNDWKVYNPDKPGYKRWGLSVTSLDGGLSGDPDLTSLYEFNARRGTSYNEMSFRKRTPVYDECKEIQPVLAPFLPFLGRAHFLKLDQGGYFPYHRDSYAPGGADFRVFMPLNNGNLRDFVFLLGTERIQLEPGRAYFINTRMEHALFSFEDDSLHLVLNLELSRESVEAICRNVAST